MNLVFEKAQVQDIESIFALSRELIDKYENISQIDYDRVLLWVRKKIEENIGEYRCIFLDKQNAGYFRFCPSYGKMEIDDLYVFPEFQNRGIGTSVIKKCLAESDLPVFLYVFIRNERAVSLYKRLGFEVTQTIRDSRYIMEYRVKA